MIDVDPKYSIGDVVWHATSFRGSCDVTDCPDCIGSGKWEAVAPSGYTRAIDCPRCEGKKTLSQYGEIASVSKVTIGQCRVVFSNEAKFCDDGVTYMAYETGIGSGSVYKQESLFANELSARAYANALAATQNAKLDEVDPNRVKRREIKSWSIEHAIQWECGEKQRDAQSKLGLLIYAISEAAADYIPGVDSNDQIIVCRHILRDHPESLADLDDRLSRS
jgi:hypothetical protein